MLTTPSATHMLPAAWRIITRVGWAADGALVTVVLGWSLWFAVAWARFGHAASRGAPDVLVDQFMPVYEVVECHEIRVAAATAITYEAARSPDLERSAIVHAIFAGRGALFSRTRRRSVAPVPPEVGD